MHLKIADVSKGTFSLPTPIDNQEKKLKIGIRSIGYWVGIYNISEDQRCHLTKEGEADVNFIIQAGLYNFKELSRILRKRVSGINISLDKTSGLVLLTIPDGANLWLPNEVKYLLGLDDEGWLQGEYISDRPAEFLPAGGINIYLNELSTSDNLSTNKSGKLVISNLLGNIPMVSGNFAQYSLITFDKPIFIDLAAGNINQFDFRLKLEWGDGTQQKLDNHSLPVSLGLEIK